jgi:endoglucanase
MKDQIAYSTRSQDTYLNCKDIVATMDWGGGNAPTSTVIAALYRTHRMTGDPKYLKIMQDGSAHILGANQIGMSMTVGIGVRCPTAPLHEDSISMGVPPPIGITLYGWATPSQMMPPNYSWVWGPTGAMPTTDATKRIDPPLGSLPQYEFLIQYPYLVISQEYTFHQTIATTAAMWMYLDAQTQA